MRRYLIAIGVAIILAVPVMAQDATAEPTLPSSPTQPVVEEEQPAPPPIDVVEPTQEDRDQTEQEFDQVLTDSDQILHYMIAWLINAVVVAAAAGTATALVIKNTYVPIMDKLRGVFGIGENWQLPLTIGAAVIASIVEVSNGLVILADNPFINLYDLNPILNFVINVALLTVATQVAPDSWTVIQNRLQDVKSIVDIIEKPRPPTYTGPKGPEEIDPTPQGRMR